MNVRLVCHRNPFRCSRPSLWRAFGALFASSWLVAAGCNPFQTGTPQPPSGTAVDYPAPTTPDNVLTILRLALGAGDSRPYLDELSSTFSFTPDPLQLGENAFRNFPSAWGRVQEEVFLTSLFANADSVVAAWNGELSQIQGTEADVTADYVITVYRSGQSPAVYSGRAEFVMEQIAGEWDIRTWSDFVEGTDTQTWGLLRAQFLAAG